MLAKTYLYIHNSTLYITAAYYKGTILIQHIH